MINECSCCGYSLCLEKHHPDKKERIITVHNWTTGELIEYDWIDSDDETNIRSKYGKIIKEKGHHISITVELRHINPDIWKYVCPNCHRLIHTPKYKLNIDKLRRYILIARLNKIELTKDMIIILNQIRFMKCPNKAYTKINKENENKWKELEQLIRNIKGEKDFDIIIWK